MKSTDIHNGIDSELKRVQIQNHQNFSAWYAALKPHAQKVLDFILKEDVTPDLILQAQQSPNEEWEKFQFLRVIGGGNSDPEIKPALTNICLENILLEVDVFDRSEE